jgi:hypothetical protein
MMTPDDIRYELEMAFTSALRGAAEECRYVAADHKLAAAELYKAAAQIGEILLRQAPPDTEDEPDEPSGGGL